MADEVKDSVIVAGLRTGDRDAWHALYAKYSVRLCRYVARLVGGDDHAVKEVFQETMLAAAKGGRSLAADTRLWAWLSRIAHNHSARFWRTRYRDSSESLPDGDQLESADDLDPATALSRRETAAVVRSVLAAMDASYVALLTAKYIDGLTVPQIVELMGGTFESVRSKIARARGEFRNRYQRLARQPAADSPLAEDSSPLEGDL